MLRQIPSVAQVYSVLLFVVAPETYEPHYGLE